MTNATPRGLSPRFALPLLLFILLAGFTLRVWNINFDRGIGSHPDERSTACFYAAGLRLPASWDEFRDPRRSPLNPLWDVAQQQRRSFTYGHFPLYLGTAVAHGLHALTPVAQAVNLPEGVTELLARADSACDAIAVGGRLTIALLDTLTILFLYLLGCRFAGRGGGLLAAAFYAFTAQAIQLSHFFAMDPASTTFVVLAVLGGAIMIQRRGFGAALLTGVAAGLAISSKFSSAPVLAVPLVAALLASWREVQKSQDAGRPADGRVFFGAVVGVLLAWLAAVATFALTSPYAILDWQSFVQATLVEQGLMVRGVADFPFTRQYRNTLPYVYFLEQQLHWGLGWALGLVAALGVGYALFELVRSAWRLVATWLAMARTRPQRRWLSDPQLMNLVVWSWVIPYFGLTGAFLAKFNRYMSPLLPFALLWAAWFIVVLWRGRTVAQAACVAPAAPVAGLGTSRAPNSTDLTDLTDVPDAPDQVSPPGAPVTLPGQSAPAAPPTEDAAPGPVDERRWGWTRIVAVALAVIGLVGGIFWSLAYVNGVYNREHTWLTASRWFYQNAEPGSTILWELWDDPLPKSIPGEPGMDMGSAGLTNIDWSPYEEDTAEKFEILKQKLRAADYVAYSSKRIYDSVDELPERYPLTNLYYQAMRDGRLGFELAAEFTAPPSLFGLTFDDRHADESWSLYDHPQVSIFRKVRELSDAEYDALFGRVWADAAPYYRGEDSPLSPLLEFLGLGSQESNAGLLNRIIALAGGETAVQAPVEERRSLMLERPLRSLPVVDNYRWNVAASESTPLAIAWWWLVLTLVGWLAWPIGFVIFRPLRDAGYLLCRTFGWLLGGWLLWILVNVGVLGNTVAGAWISLAVLAVPSALFAVRYRRELGGFLRRNWPVFVAGELVAAAAFLFFVWIRLLNPDLWQPWLGGEKQMEFAFLNGILRSPSFPPVDPHFAGGFINYYYFGIYLVAYLIKLTGIYAEVAFNLTIPTLFALTVVNTFAVAYSAVRGYAPGSGRARLLPWTAGLGAALLAPLFVTLIGNLDGFAQVIRNLALLSPTQFQSALPGLKPLVDAVAAVPQVMGGQATLPAYDFWGPSRVIPPTINEFPYWSFLFADLHPHIIGIPLAAMFLGLTLALIESAAEDWRRRWRYGLGLLATFALFLGALASVNLWELPTYLGLGLLAYLVSQFRGHGRIDWPVTLLAGVVYPVGAYLLFLPFFRSYVNVGASGVGLVRAPDEPGLWLLVWGFFGFVLISWLLLTTTRPARPVLGEDGHVVARPAGIERALSLFGRRFDQLPRALHLHGRLVQHPRFLYLLFLSLAPITLAIAAVALLFGWAVLALCLALLGLAAAALWQRGRAADSGSLLANTLTATGLAILAGTQIFYLKDFLNGSDYYRMNTLFKFFSQVWVIWGVAAAVAVPRLFAYFFPAGTGTEAGAGVVATPGPTRRWLRWVWMPGFALLLIASLAYPLLGTPARVDQRLLGWRPPMGTLNGLDFMREGTYAWPDFNNVFELRYDWGAIQWLLRAVRGNAVIAESSEVDYYRAFGTRIASATGLSGLKGMHEQEQRYPEEVGYRDGLHRELWSSVDPYRIRQLLDELQVDLIYVGQLERRLHPNAVNTLAEMAGAGELTPIFENEKTIIYAVPGRLQQDADGSYRPAAG